MPSCLYAYTTPNILWPFEAYSIIYGFSPRGTDWLKSSLHYDDWLLVASSVSPCSLLRAVSSHIELQRGYPSEAISRCKNSY